MGRSMFAQYCMDGHVGCFGKEDKYSNVGKIDKNQECQRDLVDEFIQTYGQKSNNLNKSMLLGGALDRFDIAENYMSWIAVGLVVAFSAILIKWYNHDSFKFSMQIVIKRHRLLFVCVFMNLFFVSI